MPMKIRDSYGEKKIDLPSGGVLIIAEDGRTLFEIRLARGGVGIEISGGDVCKVQDVIYDEQITVAPVSSNRIRVFRQPYKE